MTNKLIFEMSANTRLLRQHLAKAEIGQLLKYDELSQVISEPVTGGHGSLQSALRSLLKHERMVFASIRGEGLKRLADGEIVAAAERDVDSIRRRARKSVSRITAIQDYGALTPAQQLAHTTRLSLFTAVADIASDKGMRKIEKTATGRSTELPLADTLKAFLT